MSIAAVTTGSVAPVAERTMSTSANAFARSSQGTVQPWKWVASAFAFSGERFAKRICFTPSSARRRAVSSTVSPAPRRRTLHSEIDSKIRPTRERAMPGTETGRDPSEVSVRTRLPHSRADWKSLPVTARAVPASAARRCASRICPRIWASPRTIESRPEATRKRCLTVASPRPESAFSRRTAASTAWKREKKPASASKLSGTSLTP